MNAKAKALHKETGIAYVTALNLVRKKIEFVPVAEDCLIDAALKKLNIQQSSHNKRKCHCPRCDP